MSKGRLEAFINQRSFFPSRIEYNDYLIWAASRFEDRCAYDEEVVAVEPESAAGIVTGLRIRSCTPAGREVVRRARNLVVATGGTPHVPAVFARLAGDARLFHSARYLDRVGTLGPEGPPARRVGAARRAGCRRERLVAVRIVAEGTSRGRRCRYRRKG